MIGAGTTARRAPTVFAAAVLAATPRSRRRRLRLRAGKVLRIGMTAADIPRTLGQPDQGFEGNRFTGIPMYDALYGTWDLSSRRQALRARSRALRPNGRSTPPTRPSGPSSCARA
jgi:hypothetical protein